LKRKKVAILIGTIILALVVAVLPFMAACAEEAPTPTPTPAPTPAPKPEPIVLKALSYLPTNIGAVRFLGVYAERAEERSNGELIIDWLGAGEVIPRPDQPEALRTGVIDMALLAGAELPSYVPEGRAMLVSELTALEERELGFLDFMNELYQKNLNAYYLGRARNYGSFFQIFLKDRIERPQEELAGLRIATTAALTDALVALGAIPVVLPTEDRYTAVERGTVDAIAGGSFLSALGGGWAEVTNYFIEPQPWQSHNAIFLVNLDSLNRLPKHLQDLMIDIGAEIGPEQEAYFIADENKYRQQVIDAGIEPITLSPEDAEWYLGLANDIVWQQVKAEVSPENYLRLRELLLK